MISGNFQWKNVAKRHLPTNHPQHLCLAKDKTTKDKDQGQDNESQERNITDVLT